MSELARMRKSQMLRKMVLSYAAIVLVSVAITAVALSANFQSREIARINEHALAQLSQAEQAASLIVEQSNVVANQALTDRQIASAMTRATVDWLDRYRTYLRLRQYKNSNVLFTHLGVYNALLDEYLCEGVTVDSFSGEYAAALRQNADANTFYLPQVIGNPYAIQYETPRRVLTIAYLNQYKAASDKSCFTVSIDQSSLVSRVADAQNPQALFAIDRAGRIVSHMVPARFLRSLAEEGYAQTILAAGGGSGAFVDAVDGVTSLIAYHYSPDFDWIFVSVQPYAMVAVGLFEARGLLVTLLLTVLVFALGTTCALSLRMYRPVADLVRHVDGAAEGTEAPGGAELEYLTRTFDLVIGEKRSLEDTLKNAQPILADSVYRLVLSGRMNDIPEGAESMQAELRKWSGRYFLVALARLDDTRLSREDAARAREQWRTRLSRGLRARSAFTQCKALPLDEHSLELLIQVDDAAAAREALAELREELQQATQLDVCLACGGPVEGLEDAHLSRAQARLAASYVYTLGVDGLLAYGSSPLNQSVSAGYPVEREERLHEALNRQREGQFAQELQSFRDQLAVEPAEQARHYMDQLTLSVYKQFYEFLSLQEQALLAYPDNADFRQLDADIAQLKRIGARLMERMQLQRARKSQPVLERVDEMIEARFSDAELSVEALAGEVGWSGNYLSRVYKAARGVSLNARILDARLVRAAKLLEEGDDPVGRVSALVGMPNVNYFYTVFKKRYGLTPSEYRKR